jgi:hypothetical protein
MASRIAGVGRVWVSLRRSIVGTGDLYRLDRAIRGV